MYFEILDICSRVRDLYENPDEPEEKPHLLVLDKFRYVVLRAYTYMAKGPVHMMIYPSNEPNGMVMEWVIHRTEDYVKLGLLPPDSKDRDYIYFVHDGESGIEYEVNHEKLIEHLQKLIKPIDIDSSSVYTN